MTAEFSSEERGLPRSPVTARDLAVFDRLFIARLEQRHPGYRFGISRRSAEPDHKENNQ